MEEIKYIKNLEELKIISDPLRLKILLNFSKGNKSAQDIANDLDLERSKVHYHLKIMENSGFIEVIDTNIINGIIQKIYAPVAKAFIPDFDILLDKSEPDNNSIFFIEKSNLSDFDLELNMLIKKYETQNIDESVMLIMKKIL